MDPNARYYGASANYNKPGGPVLNKRIFVLIGAILLGLLVIFVAFAIFRTLSNAPRDQLAGLIAKQDALETFTAGNQAKITSNDLRKVNGETTLFMASDSASLKAQLKSRYGLAAVPKEIAALHVDTTSTATLTQATQSGKFDETYKQLLQEKLASTLALAQSLQQGTNGQLNAALEQTIQNITTVQNELAGN